MENNFKNKILKVRFQKDIEPHEILLDKLAKRKEEELGIPEKRLEVPIFKRYLLAFFIFSVLLTLILFLRTFQLQVTENEKFLAQASENKYIFHKIGAERGVIYDKNLRQLVFNVPRFDLFCEKDKLPESSEEREQIIREISQILKTDLEILEGKIENTEQRTVLVAENLGHITLIVLETKMPELPGFKIEQSLVRDYLQGSTFSHLLGYMGKITRTELEREPQFYSISDYVGRMGVERSFEEVLRKNPGDLRVETDALGNILSKEIISLPQSGKSIVLWLDSGLQEKITQELEKELKLIGAKKAAAVALDPQTGGVLSLVSFPSFNNNIFSEGDSAAIEDLFENPQEPLFNRVISGRYPTGSTIKPLIAVAGLEEGIISATRTINCTGGILIEDYWDPDKIWEYEDWTVHGWTDLRKAIAESCNVYFYRLGGGYREQVGLGPTRIKEYLGLFGWGNKTGIDLPGELQGFIPDKDWKKEKWGQGWWDGDTYLLSIGQGYLLITPLEVATSFVPIANGGTLFEPQIVQKIIDTSSDSWQVSEEIEPQIIRENFLDPQNVEIVRQGMRQAVTGWNSPQASAILLNSLPVKAAAKTGTAETPKENIYHNWVTVFAPYDNPEIVLTIMIEDVEGLRAAALPVAKEVLEWYFTQ